MRLGGGGSRATACVAGHGIEFVPLPVGKAPLPAHDLLLATVPPAIVARTVLELQRASRQPLVLDLADAWALDGRNVYATPFHLANDLRLMRRALSAARLVLVSTPEMQRACVELGVESQRVIAVPSHRIDEPVPMLPAAPAGEFHLWVAVPFTPSIDPPGPTRNGILKRRPRQIEPVGSTAYHLFSAIAALRQRLPDFYARLRVHTAARMDPTNRDIVSWLGIESAIDPVFGVPDAADAVFVCQHGELPGARSLTAPDRLFDALGTGRPLLAALPEGDARDLVTKLGAGVVLPATDTPSLSRALETLMRQKDAGAMPAGCSPSAVAAVQPAHWGPRLVDALVACAQGLPVPDAARTLWPTA